MQQEDVNQTLPLLPLRDVVFFPHMVAPLFVGRDKSIKAIEAANERYDKKILLISQKDPNDSNPTQDTLFRVGVVASVLQILKLPDNTIKILVEAERRVELKKFYEASSYLEADFTYLEGESLSDRQEEVLLRSLFSSMIGIETSFLQE